LRASDTIYTTKGLNRGLSRFLVSKKGTVPFAPEPQQLLSCDRKIMPLIDRIFQLLPWRRTSLVGLLANEVVRECRSKVTQSICLRTEEMSPSEIRGYVKAFAVSCVVPQVDRAIRHRSMKPADRNKIIDVAIDKLATLVTHELLCQVSPAATGRTMAA
jgi:hypothetical protein